MARLGVGRDLDLKGATRRRGGLHAVGGGVAEDDRLRVVERAVDGREPTVVNAEL